MQRFDKDSFLEQVKNNHAIPDDIVLESSLVESCNVLVSEILDKKLRKSIKHYYRTRQKWSCSMCVAAWYLVRLGVIEYSQDITVARNIITILPDRFMEAEAEARRILSATKYSTKIDNICVKFFKSDYADFSDWQEFDPEEYSRRNYLNAMLPEDQGIIRFVARYLGDNYSERQLKSVIDVGAGPNLYPALTIAPFVASRGSLILADPVLENRNFLSKAVTRLDEWSEFIKLLRSIYPSRYNGAFLPKGILVDNVDIYNLPKDSFDCVISFFVAESITDNLDKVRQAMGSLRGSLKSGGVLITAHTTGAIGYFAGLSTSFPATPISIGDIESFYADLSAVCIETVHQDNNYAPMKSYKGMVIAAGIKAQ